LEQGAGYDESHERNRPELQLPDFYLYDQQLVNQFPSAVFPIYLVSILPIYLQAAAAKVQD
jgi:hypothetical protein